MNRQLEDDVNAIWNRLPSEIRVGIQRDLGFRKEDVSAEYLVQAVLSWTGPKLVEAQVKEEIARIHDAAEREIRHTSEIAQLQMENTGYKVREETRNQIGYFLQETGNRIRTALEQISGEIKRAQDRNSQVIDVNPSTQDRLPPQSGLVNVISKIPGGSYTMDCPYVEKGGPKGCINVSNRSDGVYKQCERAREAQVQRGKSVMPLPLLMSSSLKKVGCPSNPVFYKCDYVDGKVHKQSI